MLSILIPVYNFDVRNLVKDLYAQSVRMDLAFEILCFDDGSAKEYKIKNQKIGELKQVIYKELPQNLGRSKIRNELAKTAQFEYLLFMDCDSKVTSDYFIQNYIENLKPDSLLYGGRVYDSKMPSDPRLRFHWSYGIQREQVSSEIRNQRPHHAFQTNNFLIPKKIFLQILFDESLNQYGHEDTLFGFELKKRNILIEHIDNPLEHLGLENADVFLEKTKKGLENLLRLDKEYPFIETKLLKAYRFCRKTGLKYPVKWVFGVLKNRVEGKLKSGEGSLRWFDFYKLGWMLINE